MDSFNCEAFPSFILYEPNLFFFNPIETMFLWLQPIKWHIKKEMLREKGNKGDPVCVILFGYIGVERRLD